MNEPTSTPRLDAIVMQLLLELQEASENADEFGLIDDNTIACRSGDCCIRKHEDGWEYARNMQRHETPFAAWDSRNKEPHYKYTVITRQNSTACEADPQWWANHPDWNVLLRSDHKWPGRKQWICGGGVTVIDARKCLEASLRALVFPADVAVTILDAETSIVTPVVLIGEESRTIIKD